MKWCNKLYLTNSSPKWLVPIFFLTVILLFIKFMNLLYIFLYNVHEDFECILCAFYKKCTHSTKNTHTNANTDAHKGVFHQPALVLRNMSSLICENIPSTCSGKKPNHWKSKIIRFHMYSNRQDCQLATSIHFVKHLTTFFATSFIQIQASSLCYTHSAINTSVLETVW